MATHATVSPGDVFPIPAHPMTPVVLAHQGGWDEMLMVLVPLLAIAGLLRLANKRARRDADAHQGPPER